MTRRRDLVRRAPVVGVKIPPWLERMASIGIVSNDPQLVRRQRCVNVVSFMVALNALSHLVILSLYSLGPLAVIHAYNTLMAVAALLVPRLHRFGDNVAAIALILVVLTGNTFAVWAFGLSSALQIYFTMAGSMLLFFGVQNWRLFLIYFGLAFVAL